MPELPEVETVRRGLAPHLVGSRVRSIRILDPRWCAPEVPATIEEGLRARTIVALDRRGKHLLWRTDAGTLIMHLRMTGILLVDPPTDVAHRRVAITFTVPAAGHTSAGGTGSAATSGTDEVRTVCFCDPRRFGTGRWFPLDGEADAWLDDRLGPEPFDPAFDGRALHAALRGRRAAIKGLLLDQRLVAGIGNIYADEALFRARIHPERAGGELSRAHCAALVEGVRDALADGIAAGGATIDDFRRVDGVVGGYQHRFLVHRRAGLPCRACGREIVRRTVAQRATYSCDHCQPRPRRRRSLSSR